MNMTYYFAQEIINNTNAARAKKYESPMEKKQEDEVRAGVMIGLPVAATIICPFSMATATVINAAIVRAIGYNLMASLGSLALAAGVGALVVVPVVALLLNFGPQGPKDKPAEEWTFSDHAVMAARRLLIISTPILSLVLGCAALGVALNPAILVATAIGMAPYALMTLASFTMGAIKTAGTYEEEGLGATSYEEDLEFTSTGNNGSIGGNSYY
jgi:hypothetical protein